MTTVTITNMFSQSFTELKNLINAGVTDPITGTKSSSRKWIYTDDPDVKSMTFTGYPILIIRPPQLSDEFVTLDGSFKDNTWGFEIEVRDKHGHLNSSNKIILEVISDELINALRNSTGLTALDSANMYNPQITSATFNSTDESMQRVQSRLFIIELNNQLNVR